MAKKEEPIVDNEVGKIKVKAKANKEKQPDGNETKGNVTKVKEKMKSKAEVVEQTVTKVDLTKPIKPEENEVKEDNVDDNRVVAEPENAEPTQEQEKVQPEAEAQETPVVEEITNTVEEKVEETAEIVEEAITENIETGKPLPESVEKLMAFMEETGGDLTDYVTLNQDYSKLDNQDLLYEYYKSTKPHLTNEEINFVMEDQFSYDEEEDTDKEIKRKKLAMKEQVAQAKLHLESVKTKYYEDIKAGSKLTKEQQEAIDFFNKNKLQSEKDYEYSKKLHENFTKKTNKVFNEKFKGFEYNVGEKKFRFNVKDPVKLKENQGDINNFIKKFLNKDNMIEDAQGYHKGLFTAMNPDQIANHFYEQGKADALKESIAKSKNVSMDPRQAHSENINTSGFKARALNSEGPDFKFKIKNNKFKK
jgi:hypothetical protein